MAALLTAANPIHGIQGRLTPFSLGLNVRLMALTLNQEIMIHPASSDVETWPKLARLQPLKLVHLLA